MFDALSKGFKNARNRLAGLTELTEQNVESALREVRLSLLEADVELGVVKAFLARVKEKALGEVVRRLAETLDLITFFTAGEKETRAWTLRRGETALDAAETIHSDIARGFIRCEVVRWDDLVAAGGHAEAARAGKQRLESKPYVVEDGDVLNIRFNV